MLKFFYKLRNEEIVDTNHEGYDYPGCYYKQIPANRYTLCSLLYFTYYFLTRDKIYIFCITMIKLKT